MDTAITAPTVVRRVADDALAAASCAAAPGALEAAGAVTRKVHEEGDRLAARLEKAFAVEAAGWKGRAGTAIASDPSIARFHRLMAAWAAERGWLRLVLLRLDGRALAFDPALETGGRHFALKTGYDPEFTGLSPGLLLRLHLLERPSLRDCSPTSSAAPPSPGSCSGPRPPARCS